MPDRQQAQPQTQPQAQALIIEAWVPADCVLTPSLVLHNLALQGIPVKREGTTITIDRGHYDCTGANYAVITLPLHGGAPWSVCCSFFSHKAAQGMDPTVLQSCWLGNCYVHWGATGAPCSHWHESGHAKTWKSEANQSEALSEAMSSVSVEPVCQNKKSKSKLNRKLAALKKKLVAVKAEVAALSQQVQAQHAATQRANQCMRDWVNLQVIERLCILEKAQATEKAPTTLTAPTAPATLTAQATEKAPTAPTALTTLTMLTALKAPTTLIKAPTKATETPTKAPTDDHCNPFDFYAIYEHYDKHHYFEDVVVPAIPAPVDAVNINSDTDEDPDWFQLIQIEKVD